MGTATAEEGDGYTCLHFFSGRDVRRADSPGCNRHCDINVFATSRRSAGTLGNGGGRRFKAEAQGGSRALPLNGGAAGHAVAGAHDRILPASAGARISGSARQTWCTCRWMQASWINGDVRLPCAPEHLKVPPKGHSARHHRRRLTSSSAMTMAKSVPAPAKPPNTRPLFTAPMGEISSKIGKPIEGRQQHHCRRHADLRAPRHRALGHFNAEPSTSRIHALADEVHRAQFQSAKRRPRTSP